MLAQNLTDELSVHDGYLVFLLRQCINNKVSSEVINGLISKLLSAKNAKSNKDLLITIADI